mgnify:CR=1 FL=1
MELRHIQEMQELRSCLEKQEYFTFSQAARLMGVSRQYIYKLVKEDKLRILQFHQINREKNGRFVRFLKVEFDRVMGVHK